MAGVSINYYDQQNDLPEIKRELREDLQQVNAQVLQDVLRRLDRAFSNFFRRVKAGEKPGYPRFQGRNRYNSFTYTQSGFSITHDNRLSLAKIGSVKIKLHREIEGRIKTCTIKYEAGQWYAVFACEVTPPLRSFVPQDDNSGSLGEVGVDLGVTHFAALSDRTFIEYPRYYRKAQKKLTSLQQSLSRKKRGSHRREKARRQLAKAHRKVRNQRRDFHHKAAKQLVDTNSLIVFEKLETDNLTRRPKPKQDEQGSYQHNGAAAKGGLNKSILDAGWGQFQRIVSYKAAWAGRDILFVDPRGTSQECSACGSTVKKNLSERRHSCVCGYNEDRDTNAAKNILKRGRRQRSTA